MLRTSMSSLICKSCAFIYIEELGDYDPDRHLPGYVSEMNLVLNQSEKLEAQIEDFHSGKVGSLPGVSATQAVNAFLRRAASLETYGIDPHPVKVMTIHFLLCFHKERFYKK